MVARLVDLPSIIESQKTLDNKQFYKVADICQMIVLERVGPDESTQAKLSSLPTSLEASLYPSGITPPLHLCRIRRFQKRVNRRTVESIEKEVARLLQDDAAAKEVTTRWAEPGEEELDDNESVASFDSDLAAELENELSQALDSDDEEEEVEEEEVRRLIWRVSI